MKKPYIEPLFSQSERECIADAIEFLLTRNRDKQRSMEIASVLHPLIEGKLKNVTEGWLMNFLIILCNRLQGYDLGYSLIDYELIDENADWL